MGIQLYNFHLNATHSACLCAGLVKKGNCSSVNYHTCNAMGKSQTKLYRLLFTIMQFSYTDYPETCGRVICLILSCGQENLLYLLQFTSGADADERIVSSLSQNRWNHSRPKGFHK